MPHGTVTFVFTDIEGSTELLKRLGDGYAEVVAEHRRILRQEFSNRNGVEMDTQGDAFFFSFGARPRRGRGSRRGPETARLAHLAGRRRCCVSA